ATENIRFARGGVDALGGDRGALGQFLTPKKTTNRKGPKTEAEKFSDIVTGAQNDIATQQMREQNVALRDNAEALAASEQRQKLLNSAALKGITLTSDMRAAIEELATAYGKASAAADRAEFIFDLGRDADNQMRSLQQARKEIGLYGEALYRARFEREMLNKAEDAGITLTDAEAREFADRAAAMARVAAGTDRGAFGEASRRQHEETMWRLGRERAEIGLTDEALRAHRIETELLAQARQKNIDLTPAEAAALGQYAREQAAAEEAIRRVTDALAEARETARGFFQDWFDGIRNGEGFFNSFANSVLNGLNRIATKMMDRAIDKFLDMMFAGNTTGSTGAGGFLDKVFGSIFGSSLPVIKLAKGGVVDRPTMFAHASGLGQMGEAGPEGVLPLKRGPDGSLGVQVHGGGNSVVNDVKVNNTYHVSGAVTPNDIVRMIRAGSEQTQAEVKRQIMGWLSEIQADGGTV